MITKIKEIHWWDPKAKQDAVTYKVWVERNSQTELHYFDSPTDRTKTPSSAASSVEDG